MNYKDVLLLLCLVISCVNTASENEDVFLWGSATSAYQCEGASTADGKGTSIWDVFSHIPNNINNNDVADIADDSYHKFKEDIHYVKSLGMNAYRFSLSWSRILPSGSYEGPESINALAIDHYNSVIDELLVNDITPFVTLYHWDLPQTLEQRYRGWLGDRVTNDFLAYADVCFTAFGDRVKMWTTINEPWTVSYMGYELGVHAPGRCSNRSHCQYGNSTTESYIVAHNMLNAHAVVADLYHSKYQPLQHGKIGIVLNQDWAEPFRVESESDQAAAQRRREFQLAWFGDPLFCGKYPQSMIDFVGPDRLPEFTTEQQRLLRNSVDFLGVNHYSTRYYVASDDSILQSNDHFERHNEKGWSKDIFATSSKYDRNGELIGPQGESEWLNDVPWGLYNVLIWINNRYFKDISSKEYCGGSSIVENSKSAVPSNRVAIYVTENGCDVPGENHISFPDVLNDQFRIDYYSGYIRAMEQARNDGVDIRGYFAWSLLDNFEWADGYDKRFGLLYVDFGDPNRSRKLKASALWYADYIQQSKNAASTDATDNAPQSVGSGCNIGGTMDNKHSQSNCSWLDILYAAIFHQFTVGAADKDRAEGASWLRHLKAQIFLGDL